MNLRIGKMPGKINDVMVSEGTTIAEALSGAGVAYEGFQVKVDGVLAKDLNATIAPGTNLILVTEKVKGN